MGLRIGITGGIGSGKSYVAKIFKALGIPFYDADRVAKNIMNEDADLRKELEFAFGAAVYGVDGLLDRTYLADIVFKDKEQLAKLNSLVHPVVIRHGEEWAGAQTTPYSLKEAALLFESGSYKSLDYTILVVAPKEVRIKRVMERDGTDRIQVEQRMDKQLPDEEKERMANFILINTGVKPILPQVLALHNKFLQEHKS